MQVTFPPFHASSLSLDLAPRCSQPFFYCSSAGQLRVQRHAPSWKLDHCHSIVCRAESDDFVLKRERDRKRIGEVLPDFAELEKGGLSSLLEIELESSYKLDTARHYEVVYLVHENCIDELQDVVQKIKDFISEKKGKIWRFNDWGMRRLAYKIKKAEKANYILMNIQISSQAINELMSLLEKDERVIRHLVIKRKQAMTEDTVPPPEYKDEDSDEYDSDEEMDEEEDEELVEAEEEGSRSNL